MNLELQDKIPTRLPDIARLIEREKTDPITAMVQSYAKIEKQLNLDIKMQESLDRRYWHWDCGASRQAHDLRIALANIKERYWKAYFLYNPEFKAKYIYPMREFFASVTGFGDIDIMGYPFDRTNLATVNRLLNEKQAEHTTKMVGYFISGLNRDIDFSNTEPSDIDPSKQQIKSEIEAVFRIQSLQYVESITNDFLVMARTGGMVLDDINHSPLDFSRKIVVKNGDELLFTIQFYKKGYFKASLTPEFKNAIDKALLV